MTTPAPRERAYKAPLIQSNVGTVSVSAWCAGTSGVELTGYRCEPGHKYPELRDRASLTLHTGAATIGFSCTRAELLALSEMLADMADTIPVEMQVAA